MLRIFVDSGSSIKQDEKKHYNVEIIPLKILLGDKEYRDGIDLSMDFFYSQLIDEGVFPKTSLPSLDETEKKIMEYVEQGDHVIILPISSGISGEPRLTVRSDRAEDLRLALPDLLLDRRFVFGQLRQLGSV